ncbi:MAG TPA: hypothetical protein VFI37_01565 [Gaiellaceae bacterium]|jgi:hypothetical protein|nr:hypothetical protein [Gaiellaceae bacterium]
MDSELELRERLAGLSTARPLQERLSGETVEEWLAAGEPTEVDLAWDDAAFRRRILGICGFEAGDGLALALRPDIGLQDAIALVRRGCAPETATRILL